MCEPANIMVYLCVSVCVCAFVRARVCACVPMNVCMNAKYITSTLHTGAILMYTRHLLAALVPP